MINLTSQYPNQIFLAVASSQLMAQVDAINASGIMNKTFPKKYGRTNAVPAPDNSGAKVTQVDVLINPNATYAFQNLTTARSYALQAANDGSNNPCFYVENNQAAQGYYQVICWGPV